MDTIELLAKFADPEVMKTLSLADRLVAGLITTLLGMGITFISLVVLQIVIGITAKFAAPAAQSEEIAASEGGPAESVETAAAKVLADEEVVAAITTALALQLKTSVDNIVIRNIERMDDSTSAWQRAGIMEQINNSL